MTDWGGPPLGGRMRVRAAVAAAVMAAATFATVSGGAGAQTPPAVPAVPAVPTEAPTAQPPTPALIDAAERAGRIDVDTAIRYRSYALSSSPLLPAEYHSDTPWHVTTVLRSVLTALPHATPATRDEVATHRGPGPAGPAEGCDVSTGPRPFSVTTEHFFIEWTAIGGGLTIGDFAAALETSWATEVK